MYKHGLINMGKWMVGAVTLPMLSACGTSYNVEHVTTLGDVAKKSGIYYYLPKTEVNVEAVATNSVETFGNFYSGSDKIPGSTRQYTDAVGNVQEFKTFKDLFNHNEKACQPGSALSVVPLEEGNLKGNPSGYKLSDFVVSTSAVADPSNFYRLNIDRSALASYSHSITINEQGIITASDSTVSDGVTPFVYNIVSSAAKLYGGFASDEESYCAELNQAKKIRSDYSTSLGKLEHERRGILTADLSNVDAAVFTVLLKDVDEKIEKLKTKFKTNNGLFEKASSKQNFVVVSKIVPEGGAYSFNSKSSNMTVSYYALKYEPEADAKVKKRVSYIAGTSASALQPVKADKALEELVSNIKLEFFPTTKLTAAEINDGKNGVSGVSGKSGYRYRVPISSTMTITNTDDSSTYAAASVQIAQYGPVVSLPASFNGSKSSLALAYNANTGGFTKATIGAEPLAATTGSQYIDVLTEHRTSRKAASEVQDAADKAAKDSADRADLDKTLALIERLEAEKKLKELQEALGLPIDE